jgi:hypothetical protein
MYSKEFKARGYGPVQEGRLFQVADAIYVESDPIVAEHDFAGRFGMNGVSVIEERGPKKGGAIGDHPEETKSSQINGGAGRGVSFRRHAGAGRRESSRSRENPVLEHNF